MPDRTCRRRLVIARYAFLIAFFALGRAGLAGPDAAATRTGQTAPPTKKPDVIFVPTPHEVVEAMLKMAGVRSTDVVYDLGCGDGRLVVTAAKEYGATGVGIDIDPVRIEEAQENARKEGVTNRVRFLQEDLFEADISDASVVTLYLLPSLNLRLRPKLWKELKVGTRIVSHAFDMGDWAPERSEDVDGRHVYMWTITEDLKRLAR